MQPRFPAITDLDPIDRDSVWFGFKSLSFRLTRFDDQKSAYLEPLLILQMGQVVKFQVEWVDAKEAKDIDHIEKEPGDEHDDVVSEDHVVNDAWKKVSGLRELSFKKFRKVLCPA